MKFWTCVSLLIGLAIAEQQQYVEFTITEGMMRLLLFYLLIDIEIYKKHSKKIASRLDYKYLFQNQIKDLKNKCLK